ncbi:MAG TPA: acyltransferase family protein, partial [Propionicimonas sp.]|nr:acyltransferase family protein [Propionicimonas sp.]
MATRIPGASSGAFSGERRAQLQSWASTRRPFLDNLKVVLITAIIAIHAVLGYASTVEVWNYTEFREVTLAPATEVVVFVLVSPFAFFLIALLFLVSGLLTPSSLERKGVGRFLRDRLLRLGLPFVVYVLLVQPTLTYALEHPLGDAPGSY